MSSDATLGAVTKFLEEDGWPHEVDKESASVHTGYAGDNGELECYAMAPQDRQLVVFYTVYPDPVPPERRATMMEAVTRINFELVNGCLELDLDEGELRFRTGIDAEGTTLSPELLRHVIYRNVLAMDAHMPALKALMEGADVETALALIDEEADEGEDEEP